MSERTYRIHVAAEMTGVSEGLIRAWERRYGVLSPNRTSAGYRAYTDADIEVLRRLKKLTQEGVSIAEAVLLLPQITKEARAHVTSMVLPQVMRACDQLPRWREEILQAANQLDQQAIERVLDEAMASLPPVTFFEEVVAPIQREVGERWHQGLLSIAEEHLVTQAARQRLIALLHQAPKRARRHVACACFPEEDHEMGLMGVSLRFRYAGWRVTFLGARTAPSHLGRVAHAVQLDAIALSAVGVGKEADFLKTLQEYRAAVPPNALLLVGGPAAVRYKSAVDSVSAKCIQTEDEWEAFFS